LLSLAHSACTQFGHEQRLHGRDLRLTAGCTECVTFSHIPQLAPVRIDARNPLFFFYLKPSRLPIANSARPRLLDLLVRYAAEARREFFRRTVAADRRYLPPSGYPAPRGIGWIKHRLVRHNAYWTWAVLRLVWRTTRLGGTPEEAAARNGAATKQVTV